MFDVRNTTRCLLVEAANIDRPDPVGLACRFLRCPTKCWLRSVKTRADRPATPHFNVGVGVRRSAFRGGQLNHNLPGRFRCAVARAFFVAAFFTTAVRFARKNARYSSWACTISAAVSGLPVLG
jgi:hypothetical protein